MVFPTHLVAAYLGSMRWGFSPVWVVTGAALPELIDKPIAIAGLVGRYQTVDHSLLLFLGLSIVVLLRDE